MNRIVELVIVAGTSFFLGTGVHGTWNPQVMDRPSTARSGELLSFKKASKISSQQDFNRSKLNQPNRVGVEPGDKKAVTALLLFRLIGAVRE